MTDYFAIELDEEALRGMSVLGLAHIGDAVYELLARTWLCAHGKTTSKGLHKDTVALVRAPAQAKAAARLMELLTEEELAIFKRGRNAKVNSVPKHAELSDYHAATGLETLFGWLYLRGGRDRLNTLFAHILED
jgi:ribonuclease-3 family protein